MKEQVTCSEKKSDEKMREEITERRNLRENGRKKVNGLGMKRKGNGEGNMKKRALGTERRGKS